MVRTIPFPPAPEPGWYEDDAFPGERPAHEHELAEDIESIADTPFNADALDGADDGIPASLAAELHAQMARDAADGMNGGGTSDAIGISDAAIGTSAPLHTLPMTVHDAAPASSTPAHDERRPERSPAPATRTYLLRNDATHQSVVIDGTLLLGRLPSDESTADGRPAARPVRLEDPTRTISRNHATITMDKDDRLWLTDHDSLNGTYLVIDGHDRKIAPGETIPITAPAVIRLGDQLFELTDDPAED